MKLLYLLKKELIEIFRQKEFLPLILVAPLLQIIILGYVVKTDIRNIPVEIINLSKKNHTEQLIQRIAATPLFHLQAVHRQYQDSMETFRKGKTKVIILFRDPSGNAATESPFPEIQVSLDGIDSNTSAIAAGYFNGILKKYMEDEFSRRGLVMPIKSSPLIRFNPTLESINYMGPGIVALLLTIMSLFMTSISLVREKEQQTMDTLLLSNLTPVEIFAGKALPMGIIGLIQMSLGLTVVILWFDIPFRGNLFYLFLAAITFLPAILSYALLISTLARTQQQALFFAWFSMVTFIFLSGLFTPVENMHRYIRPFAYINPLQYLIKIIREIFLKGNGITFFFKDLLALAAITVTVITISALSFRRFISK